MDVRDRLREDANSRVAQEAAARREPWVPAKLLSRPHELPVRHAGETPEDVGC